jgi:hypothetical protein
MIAVRACVLSLAALALPLLLAGLMTAGSGPAPRSETRAPVVAEAPALPPAPQRPDPPVKPKEKDKGNKGEPVDPLKKLGRQVELNGTKIRTATGDFAVAVIADGAALTPTLEAKSSQAQIRLEDGQRYQVWLYNYTERPVAAGLSVDGLSAFASCILDEKKPSAFLIPAAKDGKPGVHKVVGSFCDTRHSLAFQFTRKKQDERIGTIVALFHFSYPSLDELRKAEDMSRKEPVPAFAVAKRADDAYELVRSFPGRLQASVAVRCLPKEP